MGTRRFLFVVLLIGLAAPGALQAPCACGDCTEPSAAVRGCCQQAAVETPAMTCCHSEPVEPGPPAANVCTCFHGPTVNRHTPPPPPGPEQLAVATARVEKAIGVAVAAVRDRSPESRQGLDPPVFILDCAFLI